MADVVFTITIITTVVLPVEVQNGRKTQQILVELTNNDIDYYYQYQERQ